MGGWPPQMTRALPRGIPSIDPVDRFAPVMVARQRRDCATFMCIDTPCCSRSLTMLVRSTPCVPWAIPPGCPRRSGPELHARRLRYVPTRYGPPSVVRRRRPRMPAAV